jgi:hypothetical protein
MDCLGLVADETLEMKQEDLILQFDGGITTPSRYVMEKFQGLDATWSETSKNSPRRIAESTRFKNGMVPPSPCSTTRSKMSTKTPSKILVEKFSLLEEKWSSQKSLASTSRRSCTSRTSTVADQSSSRHPTTATTMDQTAHSEDKTTSRRTTASRLNVPEPSQHEQEPSSSPQIGAHHPQEEQEPGQALSSPQRQRSQRRLFIETSPASLSFSRRNSDQYSVGESTISTLSSCDGESLFDRLYQSGKRKNSPLPPVSTTPSAATPDCVGPTTPFATKSNSNATSASSGVVPKIAYTPKMALGSRLRDRVGAFQAGPKQPTQQQQQQDLHHQHSTPKAGSLTRAPRTGLRQDSSSIDSGSGSENQNTPTVQSSSSSVFDRLYRNEKRTDKLWKATPIKQQDSSSTTRSMVQSQNQDYSTFDRLYRNEKRLQKLWEATHPKQHGTSASFSSPRSSSSPKYDDTNQADYSNFDRLHRNEKRQDKLWQPPKMKNDASRPMDAPNYADRPSYDYSNFDRLYRNQKRPKRLSEGPCNPNHATPQTLLSSGEEAKSTPFTPQSQRFLPRDVTSISITQNECGDHCTSPRYRSTEPAATTSNLIGTQFTPPPTITQSTTGKTPFQVLEEEMATMPLGMDDFSLLSNSSTESTNMALVENSEGNEEQESFPAPRTMLTPEALRASHEAMAVNMTMVPSPYTKEESETLPALPTNFEESQSQDPVGALPSHGTISPDHELTIRTFEPLRDVVVSLEKEEKPVKMQLPQAIRQSSASLPSVCGLPHGFFQEELHNSSSKSGFLSLDVPTGGLVMSYRAPAGKHFFAKKIERLSAPAGRRRHRRFNTMRRRSFDCETFDARMMILTPTSLRESSAVTIQNAWRCHSAQLAACFALVQSSDVDFSFSTKTAGNGVLVHSIQMASVAHAMGKVDAWWILEGLQVDDAVVIMSWKKVLSVPLPLRVRRAEKVAVWAHCEARRARILTDSWSRRKVAILFVKAALQKAQQTESHKLIRCAVRAIETWWLRVSVLSRLIPLQSEVDEDDTARIGDDCSSVEKKGYLQQCVSTSGMDGRSSTKEIPKLVTLPERELDQYASLACKEPVNHACISNTAGVFSSREDKQELSQNRKDSVEVGQPLQLSAAVRAIQSWYRMAVAKRRSPNQVLAFRPLDGSSSEDSSDSHSAATTIQSWLRMSVVREAVRSSTDRHPDHQLDFHYNSTLALSIGPHEKGKGSLTVAGYNGMQLSSSSLLRYRALKDGSDPFKRLDASGLSLSESRVSEVAVRDIIRAYVTALRWHRRNKKAVVIQSAFRKFQSCRHYSLLQDAVSLIQHVVRRHQTLKRWSGAATMILRLWKTKRAARLYHAKRNFAIVIQCNWRRRSANRKLGRSIQAAIAVQSARRRFVVHRTFVSSRKAAIGLQRLWRKRCTIESFKLETFCAVVMQATWRKAIAHLRYSKTRISAITAQSAIRCSIARSQLVRLKTASIVIQQSWRRCVLRSIYLKQRSSALIIQSKWRKCIAIQQFHDAIWAIVIMQRKLRGFLARSQFLTLLRASVGVQRVWRLHVAKTRYIRMRFDTIKLQSLWRRFGAQSRRRNAMSAVVTCQRISRGHIQRRLDQILRLAALVIQRQARRRYAMKMLSTSQDAVAKIQSLWRTRRLEKERCFLTLTSAAARCIQRKWRAHLRRRLGAALALSMKRSRASITLQRMWRGHQIRSVFLCYSRSILYIQSWRRGVTARMAYTRSISSASRIQSLARGSVIRQRYRIRQSKVLDLQRVWRGSLVRMRHDIRQVVVTIQRTWRMYHHRSIYVSLRSAAITIQTFARKQEALALVALIITARMKAATSIQAVWRNWSAKGAYLNQVDRIRVIQKLVRGYICRRRYRETQELTGKLRHDAAVTLQRNFRAVFSRCRVLRISSSVTIQACWRGSSAREYYIQARVAALSIQSLSRRVSAVRAYSRKRDSCVKVQAAIRRRSSFVRFHGVRSAVTRIQTIWRSSICRSTFEAARTSAIVIQAFTRGVLVRRSRRRMLLASERIQSVWRGRSIRRADLNFRINSSNASNQRAFKIQWTWRMYRHKSEYVSLRSALITIQTFARKQKAIALVALIITARMKAATSIQAAWRNWSAKGAYLNQVDCIRVIQKVVRGYICRRRYRETQELIGKLRHDAAVTLQRIFRGYLVRYFIRFHGTRSSVTRIQTLWRRRICRTTYACTRMSTVVIQAVARGVLVRRSRRRMLKAAEKIQFFYRRHVQRKLSSRRQLRRERRQKRRQLAAATVVQRWFRGAHCRAMVAQQRESASKIQLQWKLFSLRNDLVNMGMSAVTLQSVFRGFSDRKKVVEAKEQGLAREQNQGVLMIHRDRSSVVIQAYWRGSLSRAYYDRVRVAATMVQALARCRSASREYSLVLDSCMRIQSIFRRRSSIVRFQASVAFVTCIQSLWRSRTAQWKYTAARNSTILAQAIVRGHLGYRKNVRFLNSLRRMQAVVRCRQSMLRYSASLSAVLFMQKHWRGSLARYSYMLARSSAITIQANTRGFICHKHRQHLSQSAMAIQHVWRSSFMRGQCALMLARHLVSTALEERKIILIQRIWRRRLAHFTYIKLRTTVVLIQSHVRTRLAVQVTATRAAVRKQRREQALKLVIAIQRAWRASRVRRQYRIAQSSVRTIQTCFRRYACQNQFIATRHLVVEVQSLWRGAIDRLHQKRRNCAARAIQSSWGVHRKHRAAAAVTLIQQHWRSSVSRSIFADACAAVTMVQALVRGVQARRQLRYFLLLLVDPAKWQMVDEAARKIQVAFFMWKMELTLWEMRSSVVLLQRSVSGQLGRSAARFALSHMNSSFRSSVLSSFARIVAASNHDVISTTLAWNRAVTRARVSASILIQSSVRRMIARNYTRLLFGKSFEFNYWPAEDAKGRTTAISVIQKAFRAWKLSRSNLAAECIQRMFRWWIAKQRLLKQLNADRLDSERLAAAIQLQSISRQIGARRKLAYARYSVTCIARHFRGMSGRRTFHQLKHVQRRLRAVVRLQVMARGCFAIQKLSCARVAAISIQAVWRKRLARRSFQTMLELQSNQTRNAALSRRQHAMSLRAAATTVQAYWRKTVSRRTYRRVLAANLVRQYEVRALERRAEYSHTVIRRKQAERLSCAAILLQTKWRTFLMRRSHCNVLRAAKLAQREIRAWLCRKAYLKKQSAVRVIKNAYRRSLDRKARRMDRTTASTVRLQSSWRRQLARRSFLSTKTLASITQRKLRERALRRNHRNNCAAVLIQARVRGMLLRVAFSKRLITSGPKVEAASQNIVRQLEQLSNAAVSKLLHRDPEAGFVDAGPCLHRLAHRVRCVESEALTSTESMAALSNLSVWSPSEGVHENKGLQLKELGATDSDLLVGKSFQVVLKILAAKPSTTPDSPSRNSSLPWHLIQERKCPPTSPYPSGDGSLPPKKHSTPKRCSKSCLSECQSEDDVELDRQTKVRLFPLDGDSRPTRHTLPPPVATIAAWVTGSRESEPARGGTGEGLAACEGSSLIGAICTPASPNVVFAAGTGNASKSKLVADANRILLEARQQLHGHPKPTGMVRITSPLRLKSALIQKFKEGLMGDPALASIQAPRINVTESIVATSQDHTLLEDPKSMQEKGCGTAGTADEEQLFGAVTDMLSPIKPTKQEEGWNWADEW